jgi:hypothetical protein
MVTPSSRFRKRTSHVSVCGVTVPAANGMPVEPPSCHCRATSKSNGRRSGSRFAEKVETHLSASGRHFLPLQIPGQWGNENAIRTSGATDGPNARPPGLPRRHIDFIVRSALLCRLVCHGELLMCVSSIAASRVPPPAREWATIGSCASASRSRGIRPVKSCPLRVISRHFRVRCGPSYGSRQPVLDGSTEQP